MGESPILVLAKIKEERGVFGKLKIIRRGDLLDHFDKNTRIKLFSASGIKDGFLMEPLLLGEYTLANLESLSGDTAELTLAEVHSREDAAKLAGKYIGLELSVARKKFHDPEDPYLFEYIDCDVFESDVQKGKVIRVEEFNFKQWLVVRTDSTEVMVPLQGPFVENIDLVHSRINMVEGNGLFEFDETA